MPKDARILTAWAEPISGLGALYRPLWIHYLDRIGTKYDLCLHPVDQSEEVQALYDISAAVNAAMICAVERIRKEVKKT